MRCSHCCVPYLSHWITNRKTLKIYGRSKNKSSWFLIYVSMYGLIITSLHVSKPIYVCISLLLAHPLSPWILECLWYPAIVSCSNESLDSMSCRAIESGSLLIGGIDGYGEHWRNPLFICSHTRVSLSRTHTFNLAEVQKTEEHSKCQVYIHLYAREWSGNT